MRRFIAAFAILAGGLAVAPTAVAQIDLEMAFDPVEAYFGQEVELFCALANLGPQDEDVTLEARISVEGFVIDPVSLMFSVGAGSESSAEIDFFAIFFGEMTMTLTATAGPYTDSAQATVIVNPPFGAPPTEDDLYELAMRVLQTLSGDPPLATEDSSWGLIKRLYR